MNKLPQVTTWLINIIFSVIYDLRYILSCNLRLRASANTFEAYRAIKLYPDYLKFGAALEAVKPLAAKHCKGNGVDVGAGRWPLPGSRAVENNTAENAYTLNESDDSLDYVFSSHTLEHLDRPWEALTEWTRVLKPGGTLFLYLPHPACEMWLTKNLRFHLWNPDPVTLEERIATEYGYELQYVTYLPDAFFSFVIIGKKK